MPPGLASEAKDAHEHIIETDLVEILSTQAACHLVTKRMPVAKIRTN